MNNVYSLFIYFIIFSVCGWIIEEIAVFIDQGKIVNRGFLVGPWCPIYGFGSIMMITTLSSYLGEPITLFVMCTAICGILEYFTSYIMEKIFHTRWWDYSDKKYQINGRICLETLVQFGVGGLVVMYIANPLFSWFISLIPFSILKIIAIILFILFVLDLVISFKIIYNFTSITSTIKKDGTDEISKMVRNVLSKKSKLFNRLEKSFPNLKMVINKYGKDSND